MTSGQAVEMVAKAHHLWWCRIPHCVHTPFPEDYSLANAVLAPLVETLDAENAELGARRQQADELRTTLDGLGNAVVAQLQDLKGRLL